MPGADKKLLSVCCLGYRHAPYARECVSAIWAGGYDNVEILILDDGSDDGTVAELEKAREESPFPLRIFTQENSGNIAANFNRLLAEAAGHYVLFSSLDDMPMPGSLGRMMDIGGGRAFIAHTHALRLDPDGHTELDTFAPALKANTVNDLLESEYANLHSFYIQGAIFRRDALNAAGGFDPGMLGDDIVLRTRVFSWLCKNPLPFALIDGPGCIYRRHAGNISRDATRQVKVAMEYCDKFWPDRPYPDLLKSWLLTALREQPLAQVLPVFKLGKKAMAYAGDAEIRAKMETAEKKEKEGACH